MKSILESAGETRRPVKGWLRRQCEAHWNALPWVRDYGVLQQEKLKPDSLAKEFNLSVAKKVLWWAGITTVALSGGGLAIGAVAGVAFAGTFGGTAFSYLVGTAAVPFFVYVGTTAGTAFADHICRSLRHSLNAGCPEYSQYSAWHDMYDDPMIKPEMRRSGRGPQQYEPPYESQGVGLANQGTERHTLLHNSGTGPGSLPAAGCSPTPPQK